MNIRAKIIYENEMKFECVQSIRTTFTIKKNTPKNQNEDVDWPLQIFFA